MAARPFAFPQGFRWGTATAAYQVEGAVHADGRGPSIWDTFSHTPGKTFDGQTGDVADDEYHRYPEDVALMQRLGVTVYSFSIAWPRVFPEGTGAPNPRGLDYYKRLLDQLRAAGIEPFCTLSPRPCRTRAAGRTALPATPSPTTQLTQSINSPTASRTG
jgi:beta-glucosidase